MSKNGKRMAYDGPSEKVFLWRAVVLTKDKQSLACARGCIFVLYGLLLDIESNEDELCRILSQNTFLIVIDGSGFIDVTLWFKEEDCNDI